MDSFLVHPVGADLEVRIAREMPALPDALEARIDAIWQTACARVATGGAGQLFNGRVFCIETIAPHLITGHMTEYRRLVAQTENHALFGELGIRSLAACGVLCCSGGIVIGRRHAASVYQPGMWQLCPAGSIDAGALRADGTLDYQAQLLVEIREELGLDLAAMPGAVAGPVTPLCVVEHPGSHVCDLGMALGTTLAADAVLEAHRSRGNGEYDPLRVVPIADLPAFIAWAGDTLVPPAPLFLARAGLLPRP